ncbi:MAG: hypothetical protein IKY64_03910 [Bacteroidaceae bacterium]|nr:hypothetical protein [Bacteroidaceae bacterium]
MIKVEFNVGDLEVIVNRAICEALTSNDYLSDKDNGLFNKVCYETIKRNWTRSKEQLEEFYLRCIQGAYSVAGGVLNESRYCANWGKIKDGDKYSFVLPDYVCVEDNSLEESEFLKTMLPILWHILYRVDFGHDIVKQLHIRALCFQIKKMFMMSKESQTFFRELNAAFQMRRKKIEVSHVWYMCNEVIVSLCAMRNLISLSRKKSKFVPLVQKVYNDEKQHVAQKSKEELVKQAILSMFEKTYKQSDEFIFSEQYQWRAIYHVLKKEELIDKNQCEFVEWINSFDCKFRVPCTCDSLKKKKGVEYDNEEFCWKVIGPGKGGNKMCKLLNKMNHYFQNELKLLGL